jgi:hypothetical protein
VHHFLNRLARPVALLLIAAQLLLGTPSMAAQAPAPQGTHAPCDQMPTAKHDDGCPCCPDDGGSMQNCLVMCSLAAAVAPCVFVVGVTPSHAAVYLEFSSSVPALAEPPLKPPPIA